MIAFTGRWSEATRVSGELIIDRSTSDDAGETQIRSRQKTGKYDGKVRRRRVSPKYLCIERSGRPAGSHSLISLRTTNMSARLLANVANRRATCKRRSQARSPRWVTMTRTAVPSTSSTASMAARGSLPGTLRSSRFTCEIVWFVSRAFPYSPFRRCRAGPAIAWKPVDFAR